jgi:voltage-gated potassium channel
VERKCTRFGAAADAFFAIKCYLHEQPYIVILVLLSASIILTGIAIFIFERPIDGTSFDTVWNGWWLIIVTMTTIGYGEMVPVTHLGRSTATFACIWGTFLLSMFVVALISSVILQQRESRMYELVYQSFAKKDIIESGTKLI